MSAEEDGPEVASEERPSGERPPGKPAADEAAAGPVERALPHGLSARDVAVLALERRGWSGPGVKERAIREQLDMSPTRYYQLLNALLDDRNALAHDPVTVNRLLRRREEQRARR
ncbi:hypothetical protein GCM10012287_16320 [Streptomyces daqingensis]|uniref:DUF3263 domain-containing protein n=1 Tax=Streptomyces daqingensis TaxID=1472640 RepID=A0ABQ2M359_9ACTN|nr:hypothetical protein GCM10012287_16320 [Streptomyces daqingensis]